jgi:EAL domain-containing protein (putative c-di-GMP-specific phosphodiesterase class I)/CheY-like chemotaxis protein
MSPIATGIAGRQRVYVVDDDPRANALICQLLKTIGVTPQGFTGPMQFLVQAKTHPPDVVVLDLALGQSDAVEVIRQLEIIGFSGAVLLISGRDELTLEEIRRVGLRRGLSMLPSLRKPFRAADLQRVFSAAAERQGGGPEAVANGLQMASPEFRLDLKQALQEGWLELWYQPKIDLKSLLICGAEALVRARHPEHGIVTPAQLLPPPGDPSYYALSKCVVRQALTDWGHFVDAGLPLKVAVNVPLAVLEAPDFVRNVRELLPQDARFPGLIFEITEDDAVRDPDHIHEIASQLRLYGIALSIDDFGKACSSLARLIELPCVELKIDRTFVAGCADDQVKRAVCETVSNLAHRFGISVCAEGVEQIDDLRRIISLGCDTAQGFFFSKPMERDLFIRRAMAKAASSGRGQRAASAG